MTEETKKHALLAASSSERWLACPPSARLTENYADDESSYAAEGTLAHSIAESKLQLYLKKTRKKVNCDDAEMDEMTDMYVQFITEIYEAAKQNCDDPLLLTEQKVDFSRFVPEGFGTADTILVSDGIMHLVDFKYGKGVPVYAEDNSQLKLYALGALEMLGFLYDITVIRMTIFQPRLDNTSTTEISVWRFGRRVEINGSVGYGAVGGRIEAARHSVADGEPEYCEVLVGRGQSNSDGGQR